MADPQRANARPPKLLRLLFFAPLIVIAGYFLHIIGNVSPLRSSGSGEVVLETIFLAMCAVAAFVMQVIVLLILYADRKNMRVLWIAGVNTAVVSIGWSYLILFRMVPSLSDKW